MKAIEQNKIITLSKKDGKVFISNILNPPKPNEALKKAAKAYNKVKLK